MGACTRVGGGWGEREREYRAEQSYPTPAILDFAPAFEKSDLLR